MGLSFSSIIRFHIVFFLIGFFLQRTCKWTSEQVLVWAQRTVGLSLDDAVKVAANWSGTQVADVVGHGVDALGLSDAGAAMLKEGVCLPPLEPADAVC